MSNNLIDLSEQAATGFPRPQMERAQWTSLNGRWDFHIDEKAELADPEQVSWDKSILVPFSPETAASGIEDTGFYSAVWYRRDFEAPELGPGRRLLLHFEAVDYHATVWVNGRQLRIHEGGYTPIDIDITDALLPHGTQQIVVRAEDDPADLAKPRGKQDWKLEPHSIWYPRTTGIWQTVWLEVVSSSRVQSLQWSSTLECWDISFAAAVCAKPGENLTLHVELRAGEHLLASDSYRVVSGEVHRKIALSDPGIDDYRNDLLWSPSSPTLINAELELRDEQGRVLDRIRSYTALRSVAAQGDRFILNGRPLNLRMVLDQGYWPESGLTPPDDEALLKDVLLVKQMGFNGVRKHQKIESARFLYWADRLGLLVWEEMPSAYRYTTRSIERLTREWLEVIERDKSHPCIVSWVPFNESWGVPDLPDNPAQRHYVQSLYHLTKALDPSRPVIGNDGWESVATDIIGIHDYDDNPERLAARYGTSEVESKLFQRERPGGRILTLAEEKFGAHPIVLTEFGGIAYGGSCEDTWGYSQSETVVQLQDQYRTLLECVRSLTSLAGFCYTQFADTYQEANGLLYADRTPKIPLYEIALATTGTVPDVDAHAERIWREYILGR